MTAPPSSLAGGIAGLLAATILGTIRLRPDHRLRREPDIRARPARRSMLPGVWRHRGAGPADVAAWCDALAREVRGGATLGAALRSVEPPAGAPALLTIRHRLERGFAIADALDVTAAGTDEQAALTVVGACAEHGGPAAQPLDRLAATLRRRAADAAERDVHAAQARLSALVMTVLPGAVLLLLLVTSGSVRTIASTATGLVVVALGAALNVLGWWWMRRIIGGRR